MSPSTDTPPETRDVAQEAEPVSPGPVSTVTSDVLADMPCKRPGPITLADREGVFVHSFKCSICDVEFVLFSWLPNRHGVGRTWCPECGQQTPMLHWRGKTSGSATFGAGGAEIYEMFTPVDAELLDDSVPPPDQRYDLPPLAATSPRADGPL